MQTKNVRRNPATDMMLNYQIAISSIWNNLCRHRKIIYAFLAIMMVMNFIAVDYVIAAGSNIVDDSAVKDLQSKLIEVTKKTAFPIGGALIFVSVALIAVQIIVSHYNPNARSQAMEGLKWVAIGAIILGSAIIIANIMIGLGGVQGGKIS